MTDILTLRINFLPIYVTPPKQARVQGIKASSKYRTYLDYLHAIRRTTTELLFFCLIANACVTCRDFFRTRAAVHYVVYVPMV